MAFIQLEDKFTALTSGTLSGNFANYTDLAVGNHLTLHQAFVGNTLVLTARPTVDGDVNVDGIVNAQDIALLASHWLQHGVPGER